jgi:hypothetical protein
VITEFAAALDLNRGRERAFEKFEEEPMTPRTSQASRKTARPTFDMQAWEPTLDEMLAEPVVQLMMTVDGVRPDEVVTLLREARQRLD